MKRFEYDLVVIRIDQEYVRYLNERGQDGWQLVGQHSDGRDSFFLTFMREIQ